MDLVKKNVFSIVCGVVALLCIIAVFVWPVPSVFGSLQNELDAAQLDFRQISEVSRKARPEPKISSEEPGTLDTFPTNAVITEWKKAVDSRGSQSQAALQKIESFNRHTPLIANLLPNPSSDQLRYDFRDQYLNMMALTGDRRPEEAVTRIMNAGLAPTDEDRTLERERIRRQVEGTLGIVDRDRNAGFANAADVQAEIDRRVANLPNVLNQKVAEGSHVYIDPQTLSLHRDIANAASFAPSMASIFNAQVGLWVQQDVARSIEQMNTEAFAKLPPDAKKDVRMAPVKHVLRISVPDNALGARGSFGGDSFAQPTGTQPDGSEGGGGGVALPTDASTDIPTNPEYPTTRVQNPFYDICRFELVIRCEAPLISQVIAGLSRNKLVTVTQVEYVNPVNVAEAYEQGYIYASADHAVPIVEMKLKCEALFLRTWLKDLMPDDVKQALAYQPQPTQ